MVRNRILMSVLYFGIGFGILFVWYKGWSLGPQDISMPAFWFAYVLGLISLGLTSVTDPVYEVSPLWGVVWMSYAIAYRFNPTPTCISLLLGTILIFLTVRIIYRRIFHKH